MADDRSLQWNLTADGSGASKRYHGGVGTLHIYGDFGGGTLSIKGSTRGQNGTFTAYAVTYTEAVITVFEAGNIMVQPVLADSTDPNLYIDIVPSDR
jgi:hypothetical protein